MASSGSLQGMKLAVGTDAAYLSAKQMTLGATDADAFVPDTLGAETVVVTSIPERKKLLLPSGVQLPVGSLTAKQDERNDVIIETADMLKILGTPNMHGDYLLHNSKAANVAATVATIDEAVPAVNINQESTWMIASKATEKEQSIRGLRKRETDRLKKREQRADPAYREKEKAKAKARMRLRRADPAYREVERRRDRMRRKVSRMQNEILRQREKDRDRAYKLLHRNMPLNTVVTEVEITDESGDHSLDADDGTILKLDEQTVKNDVSDMMHCLVGNATGADAAKVPSEQIQLETRTGMMACLGMANRSVSEQEMCCGIMDSIADSTVIVLEEGHRRSNTILLDGT